MKRIFIFSIGLSLMLVFSINRICAQSSKLNLGEALDHHITKGKTITREVNLNKEAEMTGRNLTEKSHSKNIIGFVLFAVLELILASVTVLAYKKKIKLSQKKKLKIEKQNISVIRNENKVTVKNPKLEFVRKNFRYKRLGLNTKNLDITKTAKKNNISKGEVVLAMKLNNLALRAK